MSTDNYVDGNAIGGLLIDVFGREMTDARGCCADCGAVHPIAEFMVFRSGPGDVVRCPGCATVLMVAIPIAAGPRVYFSGLRWLAPGTDAREKEAQKERA